MKHIYKIILGIVLFLHLALTFAFQLPDPTRPVRYQDHHATQNPLNLTAILISENRKIATIDGIAVKPGDDIEGYRVIAIQPDSVQLQGSSGMITLYLVRSIRQPVDEK